MTPDHGQSIGRTDAGITEHSLPPFNGLLLTEQQVWAGMRVAIVLDGHDQIEIDEQGAPLLLDALMGGVPHRLKFYPVEGGIVRTGNEKDSLQVATGMEDFRSDVRFMPTEVYTPAEAPVGSDFAVFKDGNVVRYGTRPRDRAVVVRIYKDGRGVFDNQEYDWLGDHPDFSLPEGLVLVPITNPRHSNHRPPDIWPGPSLKSIQVEERVISQLFATRTSVERPQLHT